MNTEDLPLMYYCVFWCGFIDLVDFFALFRNPRNSVLPYLFDKAPNSTNRQCHRLNKPIEYNKIDLTENN